MIKRKPFKNIFIVFLKTIGKFFQKRSTTFVENSITVVKFIRLMQKYNLCDLIVD